MSHFDNINFTAARPANLVEVVAHHPECRPKSVGGVGEAYCGFDFAVFEGEKVFGGYTARGERFSLIVFAAGCENQTSVALAVIAYTYVLFAVGVILQFVVAATVAVYLYVPSFGFEFA